MLGLLPSIKHYRDICNYLYFRIDPVGAANLASEFIAGRCRSSGAATVLGPTQRCKCNPCIDCSTVTALVYSAVHIRVCRITHSSLVSHSKFRNISQMCPRMVHEFESGQQQHLHRSADRATQNSCSNNQHRQQLLLLLQQQLPSTSTWPTPTSITHVL